MRKTLGGLALVVSAVLLTGCGGSSGDKASHEVTLEVLGQGKTQVLFNLDTNGGGEVSLPWKRTAKLTLTDAEKQDGSLVSVAPGSVKGPDGMLKAASCVITVDGKKVADNQEGKSSKACEYWLK